MKKRKVSGKNIKSLRKRVEGIRQGLIELEKLCKEHKIDFKTTEHLKRKMIETGIGNQERIARLKRSV